MYWNEILAFWGFIISIVVAISPIAIGIKLAIETAKWWNRRNY